MIVTGIQRGRVRKFLQVNIFDYLFRIMLIGFGKIRLRQYRVLFQPMNIFPVDIA